MSNYDNVADNIVRCKDCKYNPSKTEGLFNDLCPLIAAGHEYCSETPDDWFCAYGESKSK